MDDPAWEHSTFLKNRDRLPAGQIAANFLAAVLAQPKVKWLLSSDRFSVNGTLIEAWASMKSFRRQDGSDGDGGWGTGRNSERNFHGERRFNETPRSTTDPEARRRITLGADKAYDVRPFVADLRARAITLHIAVDGHVTKTGKRRSTAIDRRTRRHLG